MSAPTWLTRLSCGHQEETDLIEQPRAGSKIACRWPPCNVELREVVSAVQLRPGDEDRLMRGEAVPGARGACTREGCAHGSLYHRNPQSHSRRDYRAQRCYQPGCRCDGWTDQPGQAMPPLPPPVAMQEALW